MANTCDFQVIQNGIKYIVNLSIINNHLQVNCYEYQASNNNEFCGQYSHEQIKKFSPMFNLTTSILDDFEIFKKAIEAKKVRIKKNEKNEIYITFILEEEEDPNINVNLPLEFNNNFNNSYIEYSPIRRLPTIHVKMKTINIRRPTIYINGDGNEIEQQLINNNIIQSQKIGPFIPPIDNNNIIHNKTFTQVNQNRINYNSPLKVKSVQNYYSPVSSPEREQIEYINYGSPSRNKINYSSVSRSRNIPLQNNLRIINNSDNIKSGDINASTYNSTYNENKTNELINQLNKMKKETEEQKIKINKIIFDLKNENERLKKENIILKNQNSKIDIDSIKQQFIDEQNKAANKFEQYRKKTEEEISQYQSEIEKLLNKINILENENNKIKIEYEKLSKLSVYKRRTKLRIVKGEIIQNNEELEFLTQRICKDHKKITLNLLYKATVDSDKAEVFHRKCDNTPSSLVLVKSNNNKRFGGFTTCNWAGENIDKIDENAFVFSLDKKKIYDVIPDENAIGCYPQCGPIFLGCQIRIYDNAFENGGTTFEKGMNFNTEEDFELTGGVQKFGIEEIEVYGVEIE